MSKNDITEIFASLSDNGVREFGIYRFEQEGKYGLVKMRRQGNKAWHCASIREDAQLITPAVWDEIRIKLDYDFSNGLLGCVFFMRKNDYWSVLNQEGQAFEGFCFSQIDTDGLNDKTDYLDYFTMLDDCSPDIRVAEGNKNGVFLNCGKLIPPIYDSVERYSDGYVVQEGCLFGAYNLNCEQVIPIIYDSIRSDYICSDARRKYYEVKKDGRVGIISIDDGALVLPLEWDSITIIELSHYRETITSRSINCIVERNQKFGLFDGTAMQLLIPPVWDKVLALRSLWDTNPYGYLVCNSNQWGYVDGKGRQICEPIWDDISSFSNGVARVRSGDIVTYMDMQGNTLNSNEQIYEYFLSKMADIHSTNPDVICNHIGDEQSIRFISAGDFIYNGSKYVVKLDMNDMLWFINQDADSKHLSTVKYPELAIRLGAFFRFRSISSSADNADGINFDAIYPESSIEELNLSVRSINNLKRVGIGTVAQVMEYTEEKLKSIPASSISICEILSAVELFKLIFETRADAEI